MNFFKRTADKLKKGLKATKSVWNEGFNKAFNLNTTIDDDLIDEIEEILLLSDVGVDTTNILIKNLKKTVSEQQVKNPLEIKNILKNEMLKLIDYHENQDINLNKNLHVVLVVGVNGTGKTTSIGKLANFFKNQNKKVIISASDTFRAGAIDQLSIWANKLDISLVSNGMGSDPASVAYTAVEKSIKEKADVLLIDTAGRLHNNQNLMMELSKIQRVIKKVVADAPHEVLLVLDGSTGQNAFIQAEQFSKVTDINGLIVTKLDGTSKGGAIIGISSKMKIPIRYIGVGEAADDLIPFVPEQYLDLLLFDKNLN
ncbi:MAG: signal recognition particle-docking protein FtsY [Bacteroidota bacterium]|mgnify:FL=1|nr:signal recognition particle-docking protein FtsY [Bacteroidota bacterium]MEC7549135.1 signal recognition particle-docking protein FtsY [Bacteroidota bacterium]MEC7829766.1 signal recognition particle-docking protein FtsY [Bacteroidota bacterium]MEC9160705.1 signal recognition particle-docking protein FtsY [Bacteroidota bacterium]MED5364511.1 signal recognition particle-docking protein FtsY [Bacteroidota bacterium]